MTTTLYQRLRDYRRAIGAPWFTDPYDLNLLVLRGESVGRWDSLACLAYTTPDGAEEVFSVVVTDDASETEWTQPTHPDGCLWVRDGHYSGAYAPGKHRGRKALRQVSDMRYVRWTGQGVPTADQLEGLPGAWWGSRGTHWHDRVNDHEPPRPRPGDSEGCVVSLRKDDHGRAMALVALQEEHVGVGVVSPTFARMAVVLPRPRSTMTPDQRRANLDSAVDDFIGDGR